MVLMAIGYFMRTRNTRPYRTFRHKNFTASIGLVKKMIWRTINREIRAYLGWKYEIMRDKLKN